MSAIVTVKMSPVGAVQYKCDCCGHPGEVTIYIREEELTAVDEERSMTDDLRKMGQIVRTCSKDCMKKMTVKSEHIVSRGL